MRFLVDPNFDEFLKQYGIYFCVAIAILIVIGVVLALLIPYFKKKKSKVKKFDKNELQTALGGKENIIKYEQNGSRFVIYFKNRELINLEQIKNLGFLNYILLSNKITLTLDEKNKKYLKNILD